ncbi:MAG: pyridoxamine 5'-phosphate oxidase family protein [Pseudomonadota bacterium]
MSVSRASQETDPHTIASLEELNALYGVPVTASVVKVLHRITPAYATLIAASPFCALATCGPEGLDCSPRGDAPREGMHGTVHIENETTILMPDRRGNNRIDSLRNIVRDPRVALLFLIPGSGTTVRVNGRASLTIEPSLLRRFEVDGKAPRCVIRIAVGELYFQCARAVVRAGIWQTEKWPNFNVLPTPGTLLAEASEGREGGRAYDEAWPKRAAESMW